MKAIIFAGGTGTRLWPLSRKSSPKQFEKVVGDKSTLQLAVERLAPDFTSDDIYVFTGKRYINMVYDQLPQLPKGHAFGEPEMRDVGPAVGLSVAMLVDKYPDEPIAILWSDHMVGKPDQFRKILRDAQTLVKKDPMQIIFIGQEARFASQNLGWIEFGEVKETIDGTPMHAFKSFHYRPSLEDAQTYFEQDTYTWNIGYFVSTPRFLWEQFKQFVPEMHSSLSKIKDAAGTPEFDTVLETIYPTLEKVHFDNAVLEKIDQKYGLVVTEDLKWSDVGAWEALKEALQATPDQNVTRGKVLTTDSKDSLVYNYTDQMVVTIDLDGLIVINTKDVVLVCKKDSVPKIKSLVEGLEGTENEHLI